MVPLLFFSKFILDSPFSKEAVFFRLSEEVAPAQGSGYWSETREELFEGLVTNDTFQISRIIRYRNDLLPIIQGRFYTQETGSQIQIVMRLSLIALLFVIGLGIADIGLIMSILYPMITTGNFDHSLVMPASIATSVYLGFTLGFGFEAVIAARLLKGIFAAT